MKSSNILIVKSNCWLLDRLNRNSIFDNNCRLISISAFLAFVEYQEYHCDSRITGFA
jgi:hypothetical protein